VQREARPKARALLSEGQAKVRSCRAIEVVLGDLRPREGLLNRRSHWNWRVDMLELLILPPAEACSSEIPV
jgi:hypothetical protein